MAETLGSVAVVDLSPLTVGHVLACPRAHYFSAAEAIADPECDFAKFLDGFLRKYTQVFGRFTILEHGSTASMPTACISHAHVHILPFALEPIIGRMGDDGLAPKRLDSWQQVVDLYMGRSPYYLAADGDHLFVAPPRRRMASQYLRVVAGAVLDIPPEECDWAVVIRHDIFYQTMQRWAVDATTEGVML
ncbi:hypothetical protein [Nocardia sp. N2S4-5]|uniref:hypothetical protein n=1 Tax=Nocardia sp. N2S4-5 TaxID=3351565 RepID=UPI0037D2CF00